MVKRIPAIAPGWLSAQSLFGLLVKPGGHQLQVAFNETLACLFCIGLGALARYLAPTGLGLTNRVVGGWEDLDRHILVACLRQPPANNGHERLGRAGRETVLARYSIQRWQEPMLRIIQRTAARKAVPE